MLLIAVTSAVAATLLGSLLASGHAPEHGRCVGMFVASPGEGMPRSIAADSVSLTIRGTIPCKDAVSLWSMQGPCRVFEDGTVEFLATPVPPCPGGDYYVWIAYPK